jgi:hypothetical protein
MQRSPVTASSTASGAVRLSGPEVHDPGVEIDVAPRQFARLARSQSE